MTEGAAPSGGQTSAAPSQESGSSGLTHPKEVKAAEGFAKQAEPKEQGETAEQKAVKEAIRKHKLKIDDEEIEVDEDELKRGYQRARAANKRFEEAAAMRKQIEGLVGLIKKDPKSVLERFGVNPRDWAESYLKGELEGELMKQADPRAYELTEKERQLQQREEQLKQWEQERKKEAFERKKMEAAQRYSKKFVEALEIAKLPKSPFTVKRLAEYQAKAHAAGYDPTAQELAELVKEDASKEFRAMFGEADPESLISLFGEELAAKIRQHDLAKLKGTPQPAVAAPQKSEKKPQKMTIQEWREMREKQLFGR